MRMLLLCTTLSFATFGQQPPEGQRPTEGHPPGGGQQHEPKNLRILKPEQVMPAMQAFTKALGVKCDACHMKGDFASDDNPNKVTARKMLTMVHEINSNNFPDGKMHVTCYTCHRGATEPATAPPAAAQPAAGAPQSSN